MPSAQVARVIESQLNQWRQLLREIEGFSGPQSDCPGVRFTVGCGDAVLSAAADYLERERPRLIASLEKSDRSRRRACELAKTEK
jgi:hypothetical protein